MGSTALKSTARKILKVIADADRRKQAEYDPHAQIFILNITNLKEFCNTTGVPYAEVHNYYTKILSSMGTKFRTKPQYAYLRDYAQDLKTGRIPTTKPLPPEYEVHFVSSKGRADEAKRSTGKWLEKKFGITAASFTGVVPKGGKIEETSGFQTGHGEFGTAISGTRILAADRLLRTRKSGAVKKALEGSQLQSIVENYKKVFNISLDLNTATVLNADGSFKADYISVLSNEVAAQNLKGGKQEQRDLENFEKAIRAELDVLNQQGSPSLKDQIESVVLYNLKGKKATGKRVKKKVTTRVPPKKVAKSKSKSGKVPGKKPVERKVKVSGGNPIHLEKGQKPKAGQSPLDLQSLVPVINQTLADVIASHMGSPALNYQTGRFANSVEVTDITRTGKGYPSIGYTYMKDPYQIYEVPGGSPSYATPERDPRKIIGQSIREIAMGLIQERFYIRRG